MGGCPNSEAPKQGQNFQNHEVTGKESISSNQLKLKEKKEKQIYLSICK